MDGNIEKVQSLTGKIKTLAIDTTLTKKGMCAEAEATGKALATKVSITDIVDDLTSVADNKPLSANQGRLLKKQIDEIDPHYAENVIYDDTNVKDAIDKLSKAENIAYDGDKNVQGAIDELSDNVADVQTQMDNIDTQLGNAICINLGDEAYTGQPWKVLKSQIASIPGGRVVFGYIWTGPYASYIGYKLDDNRYGGFMILQYQALYHVYISGGKWYVKTVNDTGTEF